MCHRVSCHASMNGSAKYTQFLKLLHFTSDSKSILDFNNRYVPKYLPDDATWTNKHKSSYLTFQVQNACINLKLLALLLFNRKV